MCSILVFTTKLHYKLHESNTVMHSVNPYQKYGQGRCHQI